MVTPEVERQRLKTACAVQVARLTRSLALIDTWVWCDLHAAVDHWPVTDEQVRLMRQRADALERLIVQLGVPTNDA